MDSYADQTVVLPDTPAIQSDHQAVGLVADIQEKVQQAFTFKRSDELRAVKAYMNFRGQYGKEVKFQDSEKSRAFVKITKTKVLAAYGQLIEVLFSGGNTIPISVEPTTLPEGVAESIHVDVKDQAPPKPGEAAEMVDPIGFPGDGNDLKPGDTLLSRLNSAIREKLKGLKIKEGPGATPGTITIEPARIAAKKMQKKIIDQLEESGAIKHLRFGAMEMPLLGTGILKGPFVEKKEYPRWDADGTYNPVVKVVPKIGQVSFWNFYHDPSGRSMDDISWAFERHKLDRTQLRQLKRRPHFIASAIERCITTGPNWVPQWWENELDDSGQAVQQDQQYRWEVIEYWGYIDHALLERYNLKLPKDLSDAHEEFQVNVWICGNELIRVVLNPFTPQRIPYFVCPYELNPYNFFGVGAAENMEDCQMLMNGFTRMAIDNAVLAGHMVFEVDETNLVQGQDMVIYAGKIFRRQGGAPGQAIYSHKFNSTAQDNMMMFDRFRQLADEATGIPSYSHGNTGVTGTTRTAAGMSMLMGAAAGNIKTVVKNIDDYWLKPLGEAMFAFNMQFDFDPEIKGDLEIKAGGTASLMSKEVRSQRLMAFLQVLSNPALAPFGKFQTILRDIAESLDLDPDKTVNSMEEAQLQAMVIGAAGGMKGPGGPTGSGGAPAGANPMDPTGAGGGTIGIGAALQPQEPGFSANKSPQVAPNG